MLSVWFGWVGLGLVVYFDGSLLQLWVKQQLLHPLEGTLEAVLSHRTFRHDDRNVLHLDNSK